MAEKGLVNDDYVDAEYLYSRLTTSTASKFVEAIKYIPRAGNRTSPEGCGSRGCSHPAGAGTFPTDDPERTDSVLAHASVHATAERR